MRFERPLETSSEIEQAIELLTSSCPLNLLIRSLYLVGGELVDIDSMQLDFMTDWSKHDKDKRMDETIDRIRERFGNTSVMRCSSLQEHSTEKNRLTQIGGHKA